MSVNDVERPARVRANRGEGIRLREEILTATEQLLVEGGGDDALGLRAVAQRVGVTTPSLYRHFPGKASLVGAVCLRVWDDLTQRMLAAADQHEDPFEALRAAGHAYVRFGLDHPVQYRLLLMRPGPPAGDGRPSAQDEAALACFGHVVRATDRCVSAGVLRGDPELIAHCLWMTVHGCVSMLISTPPFPVPRDVDALVDLTIRSTGLGLAVVTGAPTEDGSGTAASGMTVGGETGTRGRIS